MPVNTVEKRLISLTSFVNFIRHFVVITGVEANKLKCLFLSIFSDNGKEATVKKALDGSIYPG